MSKKEVAQLILEEVRPEKRVDFFLVRSFSELPEEGKNNTVIGMYCTNTDERGQILNFLEEILPKKNLKVYPLKQGESLEGLSIAR